MTLDQKNSELVKVGRFGRAHGIEGEIRLFLRAFERQLFEEAVEQGPVVLSTNAGRRAYPVEGIRWGNKFGILALEGIGDRDRAEELTNFDVFVRQSDLPELDEGEFYRAELNGCDVFVLESGDSDESEWIGRVAGFFDTGSNDVMVVNLPDRPRLKVPMLEHAIADLNPEEQTVLLRPLDEWAPRGTVVSGSTEPSRNS